MGMSCLREGTTGPATFSLFVRDLPAERGFLIAAGLESALDHLSGLPVGPEDVHAFATAPLSQARSVEAYVLDPLGSRTAIAPRTAHCVLAAAGTRRIRAPVPPRATQSERLSALADRVRRRTAERTAAPAARHGRSERTPSGPYRSVPG